MAHHLRVVPLWRGHLDGHHRLLSRGQPRAWLGLGEGQGDTDFFKPQPISLIQKLQVDRMVEEGFGAVETLPRCWMAWAVTAIWPLVFLTGLTKSLPSSANGHLV